MFLPMDTQASYKCFLTQAMDHLLCTRGMSCRLKIDTPQGDFGTMQHLHFFLPNLRRGIGNLVGR
jgi:hypothetical protein